MAFCMQTAVCFKLDRLIQLHTMAACFKGRPSFILRVAVAEADANCFQNRNVFRPACSPRNLINHLQICHVAFLQ